MNVEESIPLCRKFNCQDDSDEEARQLFQQIAFMPGIQLEQIYDRQKQMSNKSQKSKKQFQTPHRQTKEQKRQKKQYQMNYQLVQTKAKSKKNRLKLHFQENGRQNKQFQDNFQQDVSNQKQKSEQQENNIKEYEKYNSQGKKKPRLIRSGRKALIQENQGFNLQELGNDPVIGFDSSYEQEGKKKPKKRAKDKKKVTTEQVTTILRQTGVVSDQQSIMSYDNGLEQLQRIKKKNKSTKATNKLFNNIDLQKGQQLQFQQIQLQIHKKQKQPNLTFLNKLNKLHQKRNCILQGAEIKERTKAYLVELAKGCKQQNEIQLQVSAPKMVRGRSGDLINNTYFVTALSGPLTNKQYGQTQKKAKKLSTREQMLEEMKARANLERSKYLTEECLVNCFKKTNLNDLQEARRLIEQKRQKKLLKDSQDQDQEDQQKEEDEDEDEKLIKNGQNQNQKEKRSITQQKINDARMRELLLQEQAGIQCHSESQSDREQEELKEDQAHSIESQKNQNQNQESELQHQSSQNEKQSQNQINSQIINSKLSDSKSLTNKQIQKSQELGQQNQEIQIQDQFGQSLGDQALGSVRSEEQQNSFHNSTNNFMNDEIQQQQSNNQISKQQNRQQKQKNENPIIVSLNEQKARKQVEELQNEGITLTRINKHKMQNVQQSNENNDTQIKDALIDNNKQQTALKENDKSLAVGGRLKMFGRLKKLTEIREQRNERRKAAQQFHEREAEEGSDNEEHDDVVKIIEGQEQEEDGVAEIEGLIDDAVEEGEEEAAFQKYIRDMQIKDRQEIRKIQRGQFRRRNQGIEVQIDQDDKERIKRMQEHIEWINKREAENNLQQQSSKQSEEKQDQEEEQPIQQQRQKLMKYLQQQFGVQTQKQVKKVKKQFQQMPISVPIQRKRTSIVNQQTPKLKKINSHLNQFMANGKISPISAITRFAGFKSKK